MGGYGGGSPCWALFPLAGVWLCHHLWEHYAYGQDSQFLREFSYPLMKGAAAFCLDWLIENGQGHLVTCPSTSAENTLVTAEGLAAQVSMATTFDMAIIGEHLDNCIAAAAVLGIDQDLARQWREARGTALPHAGGAQGRPARVVSRLGERGPAPPPYLAPLGPLGSMLIV